MNFLELAQQLRQECGVAGIGPLAVTGQVGQAKKLVDWIATAWLEIQGLHDGWDFMRKDFQFNVDAGTEQTTPVQAGITDFRYWHKRTLRCWRTAIGTTDEQWLVEWGYSVLRDTYRFNANRSLQGRPAVFAEAPRTKALLFGPLPDAQYTVAGEYQARPVRLAADADIPDLGTSQHLDMIVVYKAMQYYGLYESAPEVVARGKEQYAALRTQLEREQLPEVCLGEPLA